MSTAWPEVQRFTGEHLARIRMPVGGIGTGCISFGGRGQLVDWEVQNRPAKGFSPPHSFFAVQASTGTQTWTRVLERSLTDMEFAGPHGSTADNHGLPRFRHGTFTSAYPHAMVTLTDDAVPLVANVECFNPLVPGDADGSGFPALIHRVTLENISAETLNVNVCGNLTNFIGPLPTVTADEGNRFRLYEHGESCLLLGRADGVPEDATGWGTMALASLDHPATSHRLAWEDLSWGDSCLDFWDDFSADGMLEGPAVAAPVPTGSLVVSDTLPPGGATTFTFAITWHFPHRLGWVIQPDATGPVVGNHYAGRFSDAADVVHQLQDQLPELERRSITFVRSVTDRDMPLAFTEAALSNLAVLKSPTCFRIADGTFMSWEGCNDDHGTCHGSCTHVWNYQYALERLFPDLAWTMRDVEFVHSLDDAGHMSFRAGLPLESAGTKFPTAAADGQMGAIVRLHRLWRLTGDDDHLRRLWHSVRKAMEYAWIPNGWDADADGVMEGCQHVTMDVEYYGPNGVTQSWYLAALAAASDMAQAMDDHDFTERCRSVCESGARWTDQHLFNGEYYEQMIIPPEAADRIAPGLRIPFDPEYNQGGSENLDNPDFQLGAGCSADQMVGHSMALLGGLDTGLSHHHTRRAWSAVFRHNHREDFDDHFNHMRSYALADERGVLNCTFPRGNRPARPFPYYNEVWSGFEYSTAIGLMLSGELSDAEQVVMDTRHRYDGRRRNPFDEVECGHHYVRSLASWGLVEAWDYATARR